MNYWMWLFGRLKRKLWWKAVLYGLLGVFTALMAIAAKRVLPAELPFAVSQGAIESLLTIIASSMLSVTTFSLGAMTTAFGSASSNVTPRATQLLMEDNTTQNVLSTFIGAFIFSIVSLVVLKSESYGDQGRAVLFLITIMVLSLIVVQLLRWINHVVVLGRMGTTIERVEKAARDALTERLSVPYLGANPWFRAEELPAQVTPLYPDQIGYIQFVDVNLLSRICQEYKLHAWLPLNTGAFVYSDTVVAWIQGEVDDNIIEKLTDQFVIKSSRTFEQDPRFGLAVMAEVGSRALSPATNDPGTAIDVIGRQTRLMAIWSNGREDSEVKYDRLHLRPLCDEDLFEDAFMLMARDGAHLIEVQLRILKSLDALQKIGSDSFRAAAKRQAEMAMERAQNALTAKCDVARLNEFINRNVS